MTERESDNHLDLLDQIQNEFDTLLFDEKPQAIDDVMKTASDDQFESEFAMIDTAPDTPEEVNSEIGEKALFAEDIVQTFGGTERETEEHATEEHATEEHAAPIPIEGKPSAGRKMAAPRAGRSGQRAYSRRMAASAVIAFALLTAAVASTLWVFSMPADQQKQIAYKTPEKAFSNSGKKQAASENSTVKSISTDNRSAQPATKSHETHAKASTEQKPADANIKEGSRPLSSPSNAKRWIVNLASFKSEIDAQAFLASLGKSGIQTEVHPFQTKASTWYRVRATGFTSKPEAEKQLKAWMKQLRISGAWVSRQDKH